jgi:hypothetical protein|uniref:Uncharacterized protein n=1 Tax=Fagus sylvatica TaxID=28930 RepID=A0A2N9GRA0_FAGSY
MRVGHTARSDHSGHDLPNREVRVRRAALSEKKKGPEEEGVDARIKEKGEVGFCFPSFSSISIMCWWVSSEPMVARDSDSVPLF